MNTRTRSVVLAVSFVALGALTARPFAQSEPSPEAVLKFRRAQGFLNLSVTVQDNQYALVALFDALVKTPPRLGHVYFPFDARNNVTPLAIVESPKQLTLLGDARDDLDAIDRALKAEGYQGLLETFPSGTNPAQPWEAEIVSLETQRLRIAIDGFLHSHTFVELSQMRPSLRSEVETSTPSPPAVVANTAIVGRLASLYPETKALTRREVLSGLLSAALERMKDLLSQDPSMRYARGMYPLLDGRHFTAFNSEYWFFREDLPGIPPAPSLPRRMFVQLPVADEGGAGALARLQPMRRYWELTDQHDLYTQEDKTFIEKIIPNGSLEEKKVALRQALDADIGAILDLETRVDRKIRAISTFYDFGLQPEFQRPLTPITPFPPIEVLERQKFDNLVHFLQMEFSGADIGDIAVPVIEAQMIRRKERLAALGCLPVHEPQPNPGTERYPFYCGDDPRRGKETGIWYAKFKRRFGLRVSGQVLEVDEVPRNFNLRLQSIPIDLNSEPSRSFAGDPRRAFRETAFQAALGLSSIIDFSTLETIKRSYELRNSTIGQLEVTQAAIADGFRQGGQQLLRDYRRASTQFSGGRIYVAAPAVVVATFVSAEQYIKQGDRIAVVSAAHERILQIDVDTRKELARLSRPGKRFVAQFRAPIGTLIPMSGAQIRLLSAHSSAEAIKRILRSLYVTFLTTAKPTAEVIERRTPESGVGKTTIVMRLFHDDALRCVVIPPTGVGGTSKAAVLRMVQEVGFRVEMPDSSACVVMDAGVLDVPGRYTLDLDFINGAAAQEALDAEAINAARSGQ